MKWKKADSGIGFIDPNTINEYTWKLDAYYEKNVEESMLEFKDSQEPKLGDAPEGIPSFVFVHR